MNWWEAVPGLTPVGAWDAARVDSTMLFDGVGSNHIVRSSVVAGSDFLYRGFAGNGNPMVPVTPIPVPATGVVAGFWSPKRRNVLLQDTGQRYALHLSDNGQGWHSSDAAYGKYGAIGVRYFVAMVMRGSDSILYVDGNLVGSPLSSVYTIGYIRQVGYGGNGNEYNLDADEFLHGLGVWTGVATQADVQALEAALRLAVVGEPASYRGFEVFSRCNAEAPGALQAPKGWNYDAMCRRISAGNYYTGNGVIVGTVKEKSTPMNRPLRRRVRLYLEKTGEFLDETWSDAATGAYTFTGLDPGQIYTVIGYDHLHNYRAVAADNLTAENRPWA